MGLPISMTFPDLLALAVGAGAGLAVLMALLATCGTVRAAPQPEVRRTAEILFRDGLVIDVSPDVTLFVAQPPQAGASWQDLRESLGLLFPDLPHDPPDSAMRLDAADGSDVSLRVGTASGLTRIEIVAPCMGERQTRLRQAEECRQGRLQTALDASPLPIWQTDTDGRVTWFNAPFADLCRAAGVAPAGTGLFEETAAHDQASGTRRARIALSDGTDRWFELTTRETPQGRFHFATAIDALVVAEKAQRTFVQTLTKTFAHLPIGLAVFDRDHRLVLFNPALVELTQLPVDFLAARPNLLSFFDHVRENRMMPEPKSYSGWREQLAQLILDARDDRYCETWSLPSGLTYKITGRPHPDRAVAFLIEDISAEVSLTRRFRSELEMTQSVIDCFEDAVAVFSQLGILTFCNAAYRKLWKCDPDSAFADVTIVDATQDWQRACAPTPIWADLREFVLSLRDRAEWDAPLRLNAGGQMLCTVAPVTAGATMVRFSPMRSEVPVTEPAAP